MIASSHFYIFMSAGRCLVICMLLFPSGLVHHHHQHLRLCPLSSPPAPNKQKSPCCCCCSWHDDNNNYVDQPSSHPRGVERPAWDLAVEVNSHWIPKFKVFLLSNIVEIELHNPKIQNPDLDLDHDDDDYHDDHLVTKSRWWWWWCR